MGYKLNGNNTFKLWGLHGFSQYIRKKGKLKWCIKEKGERAIDNGWRFLSDIDTDEYLADVDNWCIVAYETVIEIEPAILAIYDMPVGTELTLQQEGKRKFFIDTETGKEVDLYKEHS